jgi:hypothetical protein
MWLLFIGLDSRAFLHELVCFTPYWRRGNNLKSVLLISPVADLSDLIFLQDAEMQIYNSFSGCRNDCPLQEGMGYSFICLKSPDPTPSLSGNNFLLLLIT